VPGCWIGCAFWRAVASQFWETLARRNGLSLQGASTVEQAKARGSVDSQGQHRDGAAPMTALIPASVHSQPSRVRKRIPVWKCGVLKWSQRVESGASSHAPEYQIHFLKCAMGTPRSNCRTPASELDFTASDILPLKPEQKHLRRFSKFSSGIDRSFGTCCERSMACSTRPAGSPSVCGSAPETQLTSRRKHAIALGASDLQN
jgi:hypothetical protein